MRRIRALQLLCCAALPASAAAAETLTADTASIRARPWSRKFFGTLKGELETAMKAGGPINAIQVCNEVAPGIAKDLSEKTRHARWRAHRSRLATPPMPGCLETEVLKNFEERQSRRRRPGHSELQRHR